jgi:hypothetical protein
MQQRQLFEKRALNEKSQRLKLEGDIRYIKEKNELNLRTIRGKIEEEFRNAFNSR